MSTNVVVLEKTQNTHKKTKTNTPQSTADARENVSQNKMKIFIKKK